MYMHHTHPHTSTCNTHTHRGLVTDTAIQRRLAETFLENCHWFFPDLPATPPLSLPTSKQLPCSPTSSTPTPIPAFVPTVPISSSFQPDSSPTPPPRQKEKEVTPATNTPPPVHKQSSLPAGILPDTSSQSRPSEKPPPLETSPQITQSENSTMQQAPPPTAPKPLPAPRPGSSGNKSTNPPSPAPKPRNNSIKSQQSPVPLARTRSNDSSPPSDRPRSITSLPETFENTNGKFEQYPPSTLLASFPGHCEVSYSAWPGNKATPLLECNMMYQCLCHGHHVV